FPFLSLRENGVIRSAPANSGAECGPLPKEVGTLHETRLARTTLEKPCAFLQKDCEPCFSIGSSGRKGESRLVSLFLSRDRRQPRHHQIRQRPAQNLPRTRMILERYRSVAALLAADI